MDGWIGESVSPSDYQEHPGPLRKGDRIVLQVHRWLMPRKDAGPQFYEVAADQEGGKPVALRITKPGPARRYVCHHWRPSEFAERLEVA